MRIYVSHKISDGGVLTKEIMQKNCKAVIDFVNLLRKDFPNVDFYVPAEHEDFVHRTYTSKMLTIPQILEIDCQIIDTCDGMLVYSPDNTNSAGMQFEIDYCFGRGCKEVYIITSRSISSPITLRAHLERFFIQLEGTE